MLRHSNVPENDRLCSVFSNMIENSGLSKKAIAAIAKDVQFRWEIQTFFLRYHPREKVTNLPVYEPTVVKVADQLEQLSDILKISHKNTNIDEIVEGFKNKKFGKEGFFVVPKIKEKGYQYFLLLEKLLKYLDIYLFDISKEIDSNKMGPNRVNRYFIKKIEDRQKGNFIILPGQLGRMCRVSSVLHGRHLTGYSQFGMNSIQGLSTLITHPQRINLNSKFLPLFFTGENAEKKKFLALFFSEYAKKTLMAVKEVNKTDSGSIPTFFYPY